VSVPEIPGYRIIRELGRGGMATVYLAIQEKFDREVAVKVMDPELLSDETFSKRFRRESRIVAKLNHPHIIQVYDVGLAGHHHYLVMELVTGGELNDRLEEGLEVQTAFRVMKEMARALDFAHGQNFIHRDIKPENILFRQDGSCVLSDFGIARGMDNDTQITTMGSVVGTPYYMSPEQVTGEKLDGRSDIYSLGVVFYKALTGKVPYDGDSALNIGIRHIKDPVPKLPAGLAAMQPLIDRFMAKMPAHRYQNGSEIVAALEEFEKSNAMPRSVAKTEIIGADIVDEIKRQTGQGEAPGGAGQRPSVTKVMRVKSKRRSPLRFVVIGVGMALVIAGAAWFLLQGRGEAAAQQPVAPEVAPPAIEPEVSSAGSSEGKTVLALIDRADALRVAGAVLEPPGENALETYLQVLERDPDNRTVLAALDSIGRSIAGDGIAALEAGDEEAARAALVRADELAPGAQLVVRLDAALRRLDAGRELVRRVHEQIARGWLTKPSEDSAISVLRAALDHSPRPEGVEGARAALIARLSEVAADAHAFDMARDARPYEEAAQAVAAL
jgi:tRNA A-37 threonylcarbamoyl transferase component Bud32/tetratricopeptide (TPR) repeat protein